MLFCCCCGCCAIVTLNELLQCCISLLICSFLWDGGEYIYFGLSKLWCTIPKKLFKQLFNTSATICPRRGEKERKKLTAEKEQGIKDNGIRKRKKGENARKKAKKKKEEEKEKEGIKIYLF